MLVTEGDNGDGAILSHFMLMSMYLVAAAN